MRGMRSTSRASWMRWWRRRTGSPSSRSAGEDRERLPQLGGRRGHRVGEVHDFDAHSRELALEAEALLGAAPVVAFEEDVELQLPPGVQLVGDGLGDRLVDVLDAAHDLEA